MRPPRFFPPHQPRDAKIKPNHLRTIHKEDAEIEISQLASPSTFVTSLMALTYKLLVGRFLDSEPCFPDVGWPSSLWSARQSGARQLLAACSGRFYAYMLKQRLVRFAWSRGGQLKSCLFSTSGQNLGSVDGWLCQKSYKSLGMPMPDFRASACDQVVTGLLLLSGVWDGPFLGGLLLMRLRSGPQLGELSGGNWIGRPQRQCLVHLRGEGLEPGFGRLPA